MQTNEIFRFCSIQIRHSQPTLSQQDRLCVETCYALDRMFKKKQEALMELTECADLFACLTNCKKF